MEIGAPYNVQGTTHTIYVLGSALELQFFDTCIPGTSPWKASWFSIVRSDNERSSMCRMRDVLLFTLGIATY